MTRHAAPKCPKCESETRVLYTRYLPTGTIYRKRECANEACRAELTTHQNLEICVAVSTAVLSPFEITENPLP